MGRHDLQFARHAQLGEDRDRLLERREVRTAAADDADDRATRRRSRPVVVTACTPRSGRRGRSGPARGPSSVSVRSRSGGPSSVARTPAACRTGGGGPRVGEPFAQPEELRLAVRAGAQQVDHRGRGECGAATRGRVRVIARMCCSNCEVCGPLDRPVAELWTRGASSFTTIEPSSSQNSSDVSVPHRPIAMARSIATPVARAAISSGMGAGATDSMRIPASWTFGRRGRPRSRRPGRATRRPTARRRTRAPARPAAGCRRAAQPLDGTVDLVGVAIRIWPRPSYPPVAAFSRRGRPSASAAARTRRSSGPRATARRSRPRPR